MAIDHDLDGIWTRHRLALDDVALANAADATWLQAGQWFADIRTSSGLEAEPPSAFGGRVIRNGAEIRFLHDIDLEPADRDDRATIERDGDTLVERGVARIGQHERRYEERWQRLGGSPHHACAWRGEPGAMAVRVDDMLILLVRRGDAAGATVFSREADGWHARRHVGSLELPPAIDIVDNRDRPFAFACRDHWLGTLQWTSCAALNARKSR